MSWLKRMIGMSDKGAAKESEAPVESEEADTEEQNQVAGQAVQGLTKDIDAWLEANYGDVSQPYLKTFKLRIDQAFVKADDPAVSLKDTLKFEWDGLVAHAENKFGEITDTAISSMPTQWRDDFFGRLDMMEEFRSIIRVHLNNRKDEVLSVCYDLIDAIDHDEQKRLREQRRRDREAKGDADVILLRQMMKHREWMDILQEMHSYDVIALGMKAMENPSPASLDVNFWNAVIDHSITAAHMDPRMNEKQREVTLGMADTFMNWVRARWAQKPDTVAGCEEAWTATKAIAEYAEHRGAMFEAGLINQFGQLTGKELD
jgi:hypothetical protein